MGIRNMTVRRFDEIRRRLSEGRGLRTRWTCRPEPAQLRGAEFAGT
jgi:hypothetical protein